MNNRKEDTKPVVEERKIELYEWLRSDHLPSDIIPLDLKFRFLILVKDMDKRLSELEKDRHRHSNMSGEKW